MEFKVLQIIGKNGKDLFDNQILLVGDFNAKHSTWYENDQTNLNGVALKDLFDSLNLYQLCSEPTHLDNNGFPESLLDLIITTVPEFLNTSSACPPLSSSDHLPAIVQSVIQRKI